MWPPFLNISQNETNKLIKIRKDQEKDFNQLCKIKALQNRGEKRRSRENEEKGSRQRKVTIRTKREEDSKEKTDNKIRKQSKRMKEFCLYKT